MFYESEKYYNRGKRLILINCKFPFCNSLLLFSGGISLKPSANMDKMRADMGGAACVVGTILAASSLNLKINVKGIFKKILCMEFINFYHSFELLNMLAHELHENDVNK